MGVIKYADLSCNRCNTVFEGEDRWMPNDWGYTVTGKMVKRLRQQAKRAGWFRGSKRPGHCVPDYCPRCVYD